jgi:hypothetical protein
MRFALQLTDRRVWYFRRSADQLTEGERGDVKVGRRRNVVQWRATADENGHYSLAIPP